MAATTLARRCADLNEAELVLDIALRLERLLAKEPGVEVVLTRRTNVYVALEERTAIANRSGGRPVSLDPRQRQRECRAPADSRPIS